MAHKEIDLANPKTNTMNAGFTKEERAKFDQVVNNDLVDAFRYLYPDTLGAYSWWSYMGGAPCSKVGWRIDYFVISQPLTAFLQEVKIRSDVTGSDHCPVEMKIEL